MRQLHIHHTSVLTQNEHIRDNEKFVPYLLAEKQKQDKNLT
jgi:hypothetical protein